MNNENNIVNETNNTVTTEPVATPVVETPTPTPEVEATVTPTPVAPTPTQPVEPTPVAPKPVEPTTTTEAPQYSTPTINTNVEKVLPPQDVVTTDDSKNYNAIEEQLGTSEKTETSVQPQVADVAENVVNNEVAKDNILSSITLDDSEQSGDAEDVTFDYNAIYGNKENTEEKTTEEENKEVFSATEINLQDRTRKKTDLAPELNINALEGKEDNTKSQDNVLSEKQQDRADTRRKILFIGVIVLIIIIAIEFVFPMLLK